MRGIRASQTLIRQDLRLKVYINNVYIAIELLFDKKHYLMREYVAEKPTVYVETTVVSYLTSRPSNDAVISSRQQVTQQLWNEYFDNFDFMVSVIVISEIEQGDAKEAERRLNAVANLTALQTSSISDALAQELIDTRAMPHNSPQDAQHIAIATVHNLDYLVSWNYKHIVNENKRQHIDRVCLSMGFEPTTVCTPIELIEEIQMREKFDPPTDAILEECYRMKAEFAAQFNSMAELSAYLKEVERREKSQGRKFISPPPAKFRRKKPKQVV